MKDNDDRNIAFNDNEEPRNDFESVSDPFGGFEGIPEPGTQPQSEYLEPNYIDDEVARKVDLLNSYQPGINMPNQVPNNVESVNNYVNNQNNQPNPNYINQVNNQNLVEAPTFEDFKRVEEVLKLRSKGEKIGLLGTIISAILFIGALVYSFVIQNDLVLKISLIAGSGLVLIFLILYFASSFKRKKFISKNDINVVKNEMIAADAIKFENSKIYLTRNYIVSYDSYPIVLKYNDIGMLYNDKRTVTDGEVKVNVGMSVVTILKSGEKLVILKTTSEQDLQLVIQTILERNTCIIYGITPENKERLKKMQNFYKKDKNK